MMPVQRAGKRGPRLTANRQQQKALQSLLRQLRTDAGLRQKDISKAFGKPQAFVSYYETGARRLDLLELRNVCEVLGISLVGFVRKFEKELLDPSDGHFQHQAVPQPKLPPDIKAYFVKMGAQGGKIGGKSRAEKLTPERRSEIAKHAIEARWKKRKSNQRVM
jgi:transcriptional regulator with XRE-family HTH domain